MNRVTLSQNQKQLKLKSLELRPNKEFWDNTPFVLILDQMAQKYGKLPTELFELSVYEFTVNATVMVKAIDYETKQMEKMREEVKDKGNQTSWKNLGISYEVEKGEQDASR